MLHVTADTSAVQTERGEAFGLDSLRSLDPRRWYAVWTRSHFEQRVSEELSAKGFRVFLPKLSVWSTRGGQRHVIQVPMFAGYLFVYDIIDKHKYIEIHKARGVVGILGERWDQLSQIADREIESLLLAVDAEMPIMPHPFLDKGQRVRIISGPLKDVEGFFIENKQKKGMLVISVELLQRSVAVQVDWTRVVPA